MKIKKNGIIIVDDQEIIQSLWISFEFFLFFFILPFSFWQATEMSPSGWTIIINEQSNWDFLASGEKPEILEITKENA